MPLVSSQTLRARPKVSVAMITYKHEAFIAQAIESVLMQDVDFPVEIVIGEDCSPDGTRQIVREYAAKYPAIIRPLLPEQNIGMMKNFVTTLESASGDYVALLEGDDYWTDRTKLAQQVKFLEENPDCVLCHHRVSYIEASTGRHLRDFPDLRRRAGRVDRDGLAEENFVQTCALLFRRSAMPKLSADFLTLKLGDWPLCALLTEKGGIGYVDENMADYRIHSGGYWSQLDLDKRERASREMGLFLLSHISPRRANRWLRMLAPRTAKRLETSARTGEVWDAMKMAVKFVYQGSVMRPKFAPRLLLVAILAVKDSIGACIGNLFRRPRLTPNE